MRFLFQGLALLGGSLVARMPAIQTNYAATITKAFAGMVASSVDHTIFSRNVELAAGIGYGLAVTKGTADDGITLGGTVFAGITEATHDFTEDKYPQHATAACLEKGEIWVQVGVAVTAGQPVYFTAATGAITNVSSGNVAIPNAKFTSSTSGAGLAKIFLG